MNLRDFRSWIHPTNSFRINNALYLSLGIQSNSRLGASPRSNEAHFILFPSQLTSKVINKLYISAVSHPEGTKQGMGESSGQFASKPLEDLSWHGLIRRVFQHLQHVNCSRGQRDFPSPDALIHYIERTHPKNKDSFTFCARTTLDRSTNSHCSVVTELKRQYGERKSL